MPADIGHRRSRRDIGLLPESVLRRHASRPKSKWRNGRAKRIVFALGAFGEAGQTAPGVRSYPVAPSGQYLMRIGLVADVPNQPVVRCIENIMQGNRELDTPSPARDGRPSPRPRRSSRFAVRRPLGRDRFHSSAANRRARRSCRARGLEGIVTGASSKQDRKPVVAKAVNASDLKTKKNLD